MIAFNTNAFSQSSDQSWLPNFQSSKSFLYQIDLQRKGNGISSLLLIQPETYTEYSVVFLTQFGLKLMDFKMIDGQMETIKAVDWMDRKMVLKVLERDLRLLLFPSIQNQDFAHQKGLIKSGKTKHEYEQVQEKHRLNTSKRRNRFSIDFDYSDSVVPEKIVMKHRTINLTMQLDLLEVK